MKNFIITTDSACDGDLKSLNAQDISVINYHYTDGKQDYKDDMDDDGRAVFFQRMELGERYKTSQISQYSYEQFFLNASKKNKNILHISLTEALSNSIIQARLAASTIEENNPDIHIEIVDSLIASSGLLILIEKAIQLRDNGALLLDAYNEVSKLANNVRTYFTTDTLTYFVRGGRLSKFSGFMGNLLNIKPVLECAPNGALKVRASVRGRKKVIKYIVDKVKSNVVDPENQTLYACHADNKELMQELIDAILKEVPFKAYELHNMGPTIGAHTGPTLQSIYYIGTQRD